jgi:hypothetical protein
LRARDPAISALAQSIAYVTARAHAIRSVRSGRHAGTRGCTRKQRRAQHTRRDRLRGFDLVLGCARFSNKPSCRSVRKSFVYCRVGHSSKRWMGACASDPRRRPVQMQMQMRVRVHTA